jgi:hypothetical protein
MLGIIKGDIRYTYLSEMIDNSILSDKLEELIGIDELLLPINGINKNYTIKGTTLNLNDLLKQNCIKTIYTGKNSNELNLLCERYNIKLINFFDNECVVKNANLTAKGIIHHIHYGVKEISDSKILIVGYGNIGYYLAKLLDVYGVNYSVYSETVFEPKMLLLENKNIEYELNGKDYNIIINTVPANLNWVYKSLNKKRIIDVASEPYGFDISKIDEYSISYEIFSAIPSKFAPYSAAKIIYESLKKYCDFTNDIV